MKLLSRFDDELAARKWAERLRQEGIITYTSPEHSSRNVYVPGGLKLELWAILDNQYEDALKLLNDKATTVRHPLSEKQMVAMESRAKMNMSNLVDSLLLKCGLGVLILISLAAFLIGAWGHLNA